MFSNQGKGLTTFSWYHNVLVNLNKRNSRFKKSSATLADDQAYAVSRFATRELGGGGQNTAHPHKYSPPRTCLGDI
jgi:hypothetical protein